jgi:hypothetical protein
VFATAVVNSRTPAGCRATHAIGIEAWFLTSVRLTAAPHSDSAYEKARVSASCAVGERLPDLSGDCRWVRKPCMHRFVMWTVEAVATGFVWRERSSTCRTPTLCQPMVS